MSNEPEHIDCEQGTEFWKQLRSGLVTASRCGEMISTTKRGESAKRRDYRTELVCEILTRQPYPHVVTKEMQWGTEQEPFARAAYELERDVLVETCGFVLHPDISRFGCSPDGFVGDDGLLQIKCPTTFTHLTWMMAQTVPLEHMPQMLAEMSCTGRSWCDFMSYDPRLPAPLQRFICRYERNEQFVSTIEAEVVKFNSEIANYISQLPGGPQLVVDTLDQAAKDERDWY
jgi:hypothetical protein